jgi:hypothetical protein
MSVFLSWKKDVELFFQELSAAKEDTPLFRSIIEQYRIENT